MTDLSARPRRLVAPLGLPSTLGRGAVDLLDVAARLEMSGISDRIARSRHGHADVFSLAATVERENDGSSSSAEVARARFDLGESLRRACLLLAGVVMAAAVLSSLPLPRGAVGVIGAVGWVGGQVVAAIAWTRLGWGQGGAGLQRAGAAALLVLLLAAAAPGLLVSGTPALASMVLSLSWAAYACAVSMLVCAQRTVVALPIVVVGLVVITGVLTGRQAWAPMIVLTVAGTAVAGVVLVAVQSVRRAGGLRVPSRADWLAATPAGAQALLLAASLLLLAHNVPPTTTTALVVASVVGAAMADPAIVVLKTWLRTSAARVYLIVVAARRARWAAVLAAAGTAVVSAGAAVLVVLALNGDGSEWRATVVPAAAFTAVATTSAALTAFGAPWHSVVAAAATTAYAGTAVLSGAVAAVLVFPLMLLVATWLLLQRVSDPRVVV